MAEQAMIRNRIRHGYADDATRAAMVDDIIITLGYRYHSTAVPGGDADAPALSPGSTCPAGPVPGRRTCGSTGTANGSPPSTCSGTATCC